MSRTFCLDTNLYVEALRSSESAAALRDFVLSAFPYVVGHGVVAAELGVGARGPREVQAVRHLTLERFKGARLIVPTAADWWSAGRALAALYRRFGEHGDFARRSFWNDVVIACSCRSRGTVLITRDLVDHARIRAVVNHAYTSPYPPLA
jgi:predicted nucleic acid-binding protein